MLEVGTVRSDATKRRRTTTTREAFYYNVPVACKRTRWNQDAARLNPADVTMSLSVPTSRAVACPAPWLRLLTADRLNHSFRCKLGCECVVNVAPAGESKRGGRRENALACRPASLLGIKIGLPL
jgi:hypothetical protein